MSFYDPNIEQFVDGVDFGPNDSCIWIVYPPGCAGDLLASIVNFHYVETGAKFRGINSTGQVIFRPSDQKHSTQLASQNQLIFDQKFFYHIADKLSSINLNWSRMDQFIFSNHCWRSFDLKNILDTFKNCKIIRLLPKTTNERQVVAWLSAYKNLNTVSEPPMFDNNSTIEHSTCNDSRVLTVYFSDFLGSQTFDKFYQSIINHLGLPCALVRYDFIQFWIDQQDPKIREYIVKLTNG